MKRYISIGIVLVLVLSFAGCSGKKAEEKSEKTKEGKEIFSCYDLEVQNFADSFDGAEIASVFYRKDYETSEEYILEGETEKITELFEALSEVRVLEKTDEMATDSDDIFIFTLPTAQAFTFAFNQHHLVIGNDAYEITDDDALWKIADEIAKGTGKEKSSKKTKEEVQVIPSEASTVTLEEYQNDIFSMKIPSGWTVTYGGTGMFVSIRVYDPQNPVNQLFVLLKAMPLLRDESMRDYYTASQNMYGGTYYIMADAPALENPSTENFYKIFSDYASFAEKDEPSYSEYTFPRFNDFSVLESFEASGGMSSIALNPATLRATFTDESGRKGEGIFTADVVEITGYLQTTAALPPTYYMAYDIAAATAEENTFVEWKDILCECLRSVDYTESFVQNTIAQGIEMEANATQLSQSMSEISDGIMDSWSKRNESEDIMRQKQSDATLGYERVYDTEKQEVYKAQNGWLESHDSQRYQALPSDNLYLEPTQGELAW